MEEANSGRQRRSPRPPRALCCGACAQETGPILAVSLNAGYPDPDLPDIGQRCWFTPWTAFRARKAQAERLCADHARGDLGTRGVSAAATVFLSPDGGRQPVAARIPQVQALSSWRIYADKPRVRRHMATRPPCSRRCWRRGSRSRLRAGSSSFRGGGPVGTGSATRTLEHRRPRRAATTAGVRFALTGRVVLLSNGDWRGATGP